MFFFSQLTLSQQLLNTILNPEASEFQLTHGAQGHFLNHRQVFSFNDEWIVFDGRNEDSKIGENATIGLVNSKTGAIRVVYKVPNQTSFGPGAGAVSYHPKKNELIFIRGLLNASQEEPYAVTRRSGTGLDLSDFEFPRVFQVDARDVNSPFTPGALRGGSHAYSYSADGEWISFTYNDQLIEKQALLDPKVKDLRTVGLMINQHPVQVNSIESDSIFSGTHYAVLAAQVVPFPTPGSDEIQKAYEEVWIGNQGYLNSFGKRITRALAYLGDVLDQDGNLVTELFVSDIPQDMDQLKSSVDQRETSTSVLLVPQSITQRRITFTSHKKFPGVLGPRQWVRSSPQGDKLFFYGKSEDGIVQVFSVSPNGGDPVQVSNLLDSPDSMFSLSPDGNWIALGIKNQLFLINVPTGDAFPIGLRPDNNSDQLSNINWSTSGDKLAYNRKVVTEAGAHFQIFIIKPFKN